MYVIMKRQVTTTLEDNLWKEAKKRGISWNAALRLGVSKLCRMEDGEDMVEVNTRINELNAENKRMIENISRLQGRLYSKENSELDLTNVKRTLKKKVVKK